MNSEYIERNRAAAAELGEQFAKLGRSVTIAQGKEASDFITVIDGKYQARKWHGGEIQMSEYPYNYKRGGVSSYKSGKLREEIFKSNKMKVLSVKKIEEKLKEIDTYQAELARLEEEHRHSHAAFLKTLEGLEGLQLDYRTEHQNIDGVYQRVTTTEIIGGEIVKNGIVYTFKLQEDGYIEQNIELFYGVPNTIEAFKKLSENEYRHEKRVF